MSTDLKLPAAGVDPTIAAQTPARTFGIIDVADVTVPEIIRAIIDGDADAIKWQAGDEGAEAAVLERLARATTADELFGDQAASGWGELLDVPVEIHGFRLLPSSMEGGVTFAVVDVYRLDEGKRAVVTVSGRGVLVQLLQGLLVGAVPGVFKLVEVGKETKGRSRAQRLVRLGDLADSTLQIPAA